MARRIGDILVPLTTEQKPSEVAFNELAGLASLELLMAFDLAHKREWCVHAGGNPQGHKHEILLHATGVGSGGLTAF